MKQTTEYWPLYKTHKVKHSIISMYFHTVLSQSCVVSELLFSPFVAATLQQIIIIAWGGRQRGRKHKTRVVTTWKCYHSPSLICTCVLRSSSCVSPQPPTTHTHTHTCTKLSHMETYDLEAAIRTCCFPCLLYVFSHRGRVHGWQIYWGPCAPTNYPKRETRRSHLWSLFCLLSNFSDPSLYLFFSHLRSE